MDKILTLIGVKLARINRKFVFIGAVQECENCDSSLKSVCIGNLEKGCIYEIIEDRKIIHTCPVHQDGVTVIEVRKAPIKTALDAKSTYEGATISFHFPDCNEITCRNYKYCKPIGIQKDAKYKIVKILENILDECKKGKRLKLVEFKNSSS
ncbi:MAG: UPF0179 family protein [Candidatus Helarchaeota archaeon]|nr:UPF0179 family protein [Candidatus Helarchaeota archaeon]